MDQFKRIGPRLRAARQAHGWTLDELAQRASISTSTLSRLESGKRQANLELLLPLTNQLGIKIDDLLTHEPADPRVTRPAVRNGNLVISPLTREYSETRAFKVTYPPSSGLRPKAQTHPGNEWLYVLSGELWLQLGEREHVLTRGEAAEFDTEIPHALAAAGSEPTEVISIFNAAGERLHVHAPLK